MTRKRLLNVDWKHVKGATIRKRILRLKANADGFFMCPILTCLHVGFKSDRGLRKHIEATHPWYFYFDKQPEINRDNVIQTAKDKRKCSTHNVPAFTLEEGVGKDFLTWLNGPCGGGKSLKQGIQVARRGMKFLMVSVGETEIGKTVSEDYVDCCLGSPLIVINFFKVITEEWGISSSGALNYMKSLSDLLDFRKANGVSDDVLRSFAVTEVYIRRGKENLAKQKKLEYSRNLDLEQLIARDSWATVEEMEEVIPYHTPKYEYVLKQCSVVGSCPNVSLLAFASRFISTFLFLRVKCTRPMTYQFITLQMIETAKCNGGFIDQTTFKTHEKYAFDTLVLSDDVLQILDSYVSTVRPLLHPTCEYLILTTNGKQYTAFGSAMSLLVHQAIGKYVNPTRYRQIIETESCDKLTPSEMDVISKDQKHSSYVAKRIYQKKLSRDVATQGKSCMQKLLGSEGDIHSKQLASTISRLNTRAQSDSDLGVSDVNTRTVLPSVVPDKSDIDNTKLHTNINIPTDRSNAPTTEITVLRQIAHTAVNQEQRYESRALHDVDITANAGTNERVPCDTQYFSPDYSVRVIERDDDIEVKKEDITEAARGTGLKRFSLEEDSFLKEGIKKHGVGKWSFIVADKTLKFHPSRTRDSLRVRADTLGLSNKKKRKRKHDRVR